MPLDRETCRSFIGRELELQPTYGWGWLPDYPWRNLARSELPPRYIFRLDGLTEFGGNANGGFGLILRSGGLPSFDGLSLLFEVREAGDFDLTHRFPDVGVVLKETLDAAEAQAAGVWDSYRWYGYSRIGLPGFRLPWIGA